MQPNDSRNLPGENDPNHGWQGYFAAPSQRRQRSAAGSGFTQGWAFCFGKHQ